LLGPTEGGATCTTCYSSQWQLYTKPGCTDFNLFIGCTFTGCPVSPGPAPVSPAVDCTAAPPGNGWTASGGLYYQGPTDAGANCTTCYSSLWQNYTKAGCPTYGLFLGCEFTGCPVSPGPAPVSPGPTPVSPGPTPVSPGPTPVSPGPTPVSPVVPCEILNCGSISYNTCECICFGPDSVGCF